jgi:S-(hydroxymethyl)glutathione dehydrogenase/alcohol dehydrogenase
MAGASNIIAIDPLANKREIAEQLGATHSIEPGNDAVDLAMQLTDGVGADKAIVTVDIVNEEVVSQAFNAIRKGGTVVITGLADPMKPTIHLSGAIMTLFRKEVKGTLFGNSNPTYDIPKMLRLYRTGELKLDELITRTYTLDEINQGYDDLLAGKNLRGVIVHDAA